MGIKNIIIGISIIILTIFVSVYGINTFYPSPEYEDFCNESNGMRFINNEEDCLSIDGQWNYYENIDYKEIDRGGFCDVNYNCYKDFDKANEKYSKIVFMISIPLGILIIILGAFLFDLEAVGAGLMGGGVGTLIFGTGKYWRYSDDVIKFLTSLIGLIAVIYFAYYFNKKLKKRNLL